MNEKGGEVHIHHAGTRIETHPKLTGPYQSCSTKPEHLGPWKKALEPISSYRKAARILGANVDQLILNILERGQGFIDTKTIYGIFDFEKSYSPGAINDACKTVLEIEAPTYRAVKVLLKLHGNRGEERHATERLDKSA